jgi:hypothetical protein
LGDEAALMGQQRSRSIGRRMIGRDDDNIGGGGGTAAGSMRAGKREEKEREAGDGMQHMSRKKLWPFELHVL